MRLLSMQVESAVLRRLKLLKRLLDVNLSPEEAQALMQRVKTHTCSADDRDHLAQVIRATTRFPISFWTPRPCLSRLRLSERHRSAKPNESVSWPRPHVAAIGDSAPAGRLDMGAAKRYTNDLSRLALLSLAA
jgi:hypothetical protein